MAASLSSIQRKEDFKEEFLTCSICAEPYDNGNHTAKCLPCLHTFCKSCLSRHVGKRSKFNCPNCRQSITLSRAGSIDSLPSNFIVENLKSYQDIFNLDVVCGNCDDGAHAVSFCHDCGLFLCQNCLEYHHKLRNLRHHAVSSIKELQEKKYNPVMQCQERCKKHSKQELTLFCMERDCAKPICPTCALADHRTHQLVDLTVAMEMAVSNLHEMSASVSEQNKILVGNDESIKAAQKTLKLQFTQKKKEISKIEETLCLLVKSRCRNACSHLNQIYQTEMSCLNERSKRIESLSAQMTNACDFADRACGTSHPIQLLSSQKQITQRLTELRNAELPQGQNKSIHFVFTDEHHTAVTRFEHMLECVCDVDKSNARRKTNEGSVLIETDITELQQIEPGLCTVSLEENPQAFKECKAILHTVDANGHSITSGGARVEAKLNVHILPGKDQRSRCSVQDNQDGTYTVTYTPYWDANDLTIRINGDAIRKTPLRIWIDCENFGKSRKSRKR